MLLHHNGGRGRGKRRRRQLLSSAAAAVGLVGLLGDVAGASTQVYWSGSRASGSWYIVPGYWSYWGNEVSGPSNVTYSAAMYTSSGYSVGSGTGYNYVYVSNTSGSYVSPRCKQDSSGSVNFWCKAYY